jgi:D-alanyl-D-alanine carboxypeptidase
VVGALAVALSVTALSTVAGAAPPSAESRLRAAAQALVGDAHGPPGVVVLVQRGVRRTVISAGTARIGRSQAIRASDHMRLASVAKAFSGAAALALVSDGRMRLTDTVGELVSDTPASWSSITLAQLLQHTSGIADFSTTTAFADALTKSLLTAPPPQDLLDFVKPMALLFTPGSQYHYSNTDNVLVGLMVQDVTGTSYADALGQLVFTPFKLSQTSLPEDQYLPSPYLHGYQRDERNELEDVSQAFAAGWAWASGGVVSTPGDASTFVRAYASGRGLNASTRQQQLAFVPGSSEPPGPGTNAAGLGLFRYETSCGTVYGHTGNTAGYTQFMAATADGSRSVTVTVSAQITPKSDAQEFTRLRNLYRLGVCAATAR